MRMKREDGALVVSKKVKVRKEYSENLMNEEIGEKATVSSIGRETCGKWVTIHKNIDKEELP